MLSIICACKNSKKTLANTLKSVFNQITFDFEILIIDASDNEEIKDYCINLNENKLRYIFSNDNSIYEAWNLGVKKATGNSVFFLNSDDTLYNTLNLKILYEEHLKNNIQGLTHGNLIYINNNLKKERGGELTNRRFTFGMSKTLLTPATIINKSLFNKVGFYNTRYKISSDVDFIYKCLKLSSVKTLYIPIPIINMYAGGISFNRRKEAMKEFRDIIRNHESDINKILFDVNEYFFNPIKKFILKFVR